MKRTLLTCLGVAVVWLAGCKRDEEIEVYTVAKPGDSGATVPPAMAGGDAAGAARPGGDPHAGLAGVPPAGGGATDPHAGLPKGAKPPGPVGPPPAKALVGKTPDAWQAGQGSSMRQASFAVKGEAGAVADISLVILRGSAGGLLDNVNRWCEQLGQPTLDQAALDQTAQRISTPVGEAVLVDIEGVPQSADAASDGRIVAAVIERPQETWFYKLRGNPALVGAQKQAFIDWIASVKQEEVDKK